MYYSSIFPIERRVISTSTSHLSVVQTLESYKTLKATYTQNDGYWIVKIFQLSNIQFGSYHQLIKR